MTRRNAARRHEGGQRWRRTAAIAAMVVCGFAIAPQAGYAAPERPAGAAVNTGPAAHPAEGGSPAPRKNHKKAKPAASPSASTTPTAGPQKTRPGKTASASANPSPRKTLTPSPRKTLTPSPRTTLTPSPRKTLTPGPRTTGYLAAPNRIDAAAEPGATARVETAGPPVLTAGWLDATVADHVMTQIVLTVTRDDSSTIMTGLGYTVALPTGLYIADSGITNFCGGAVTATLGASTITMSGGQIGSGLFSCLLRVKVATESSGTYTVTSASASGLSSTMVNSITTQTLTVTPALPVLGATFAPATINVRDTSTLSLGIHRSDHNTSSTSSGMGLTVTLPSGVAVGSAATTNTCNGTLTATAGAGTFALTGGSMTGGAVTCTITVPMTPTTYGNKFLYDSAATSVTGMTAHLAALCVEHGHVLETEGCPTTLHVNALPQTITFAQPTNVSVARGTVTPTATSTSGLAVTLTSSTTAVCTVSGGTVTLVSAGTCTLTAHQAGDTAYAAATDVPRSFTVRTPTAPPTGVTATAGVSSITATWVVPSDIDGLTGYTAIANPGPATCTTTGALTCVMGGTAGVTYTVTVVADNPAGDSVAAGPSNQVTPTAPAIGDTPPTTTLDLTTDKGLITTAVPNQDIIVIGTGFAAYSTATIVIYSSPIVLGTAVTDGSGNFAKPVTIPVGMAVGRHTMIAAGVDPQGAPHSLALAVTLQAAGSGGGSASGSRSLAVTGQATDLLFLLGLAAVAGGTGLLRAGRRRQPAG